MCAFIWRWFLVSLSVAFKPAGAARQLVNTSCCVPRRPAVLLFFSSRFYCRAAAASYAQQCKLLCYNSKGCKPSHVSRLSCCLHFYPPQKKQEELDCFGTEFVCNIWGHWSTSSTSTSSFLSQRHSLAVVVWGVVMSMKAIKRWKPVKKWSSYERTRCRMNRIVKTIHHHVWVHFKVSPSWEWDAAWKPLAASKQKLCSDSGLNLEFMVGSYQVVSNEITVQKTKVLNRF